MSRSLDDLHPTVKEQALELKKLALEKLGLNIIFTQTLRTEEEQIALYSQGRNNLTTTNQLRAKAGLSPIGEKENRQIVTKAQTVKSSMHFYGLAFDIAITDPSGKKIDWDHSDWNRNNISDWDEVGKLGTSIGLEWGGNWSSMIDPPHFQNRLGHTLADLKSGFVKLT